MDEARRVVAWHDRWMDWDNAPDPSPAWDAAEDARFEAAASRLLATIRAELGDTFEVVDERRR